MTRPASSTILARHPALRWPGMRDLLRSLRDDGPGLTDDLTGRLGWSATRTRDRLGTLRRAGCVMSDHVALPTGGRRHRHAITDAGREALVALEVEAKAKAKGKARGKAGTAGRRTA